MPVLVTNKHVVAGATDGLITLLRAADGEPVLGSAVQLGFTENDSVGHPDPKIDVAAALIGNAITQFERHGTPVFFRVLGRDVFPSAETIDELDVVEPVTFVGYPTRSLIRPI